MTRDEAKRMIEVLQWIVDEKDVEFRILGTSGEWFPLEIRIINGPCTVYEYRLKPREPMGFWTIIYSDGGIGPKCKTRREALGYADHPSMRVAKFREVIDEDES